MRFHWGNAIILVFIAFAIFMFYFLINSFRANVDYAEPNSYNKGLKYSNIYDRKVKTQKGNYKLSLRKIEQSLLIQTNVKKPSSIHGILYLIRPSNAALDRKYQLNINSTGIQKINSEQLLPGFWRYKIIWDYDGSELYSEGKVTI